MCASKDTVFDGKMASMVAQQLTSLAHNKNGLAFYTELVTHRARDEDLQHRQ